MNLRTVTLIAGVLQALAGLTSFANYLNFLVSGGWRHNVGTLLTWPISIAAEAALAFFFFYLVVRQPSERKAP